MPPAARMPPATSPTVAMVPSLPMLECADTAPAWFEQLWTELQSLCCVCQAEIVTTP